jgi:transposase
MRGDLTDEEWAIIGNLLPPERGRWSRPAQDNRLFLNGMLYVLRVGCPWRDMHERYGKWNSVYVRFRRWAEQGVWDAQRWSRLFGQFLDLNKLYPVVVMPPF